MLSSPRQSGRTVCLLHEMQAHASGRFEIVVSPLLLAELGTVLAREKFRPFLTTEQAARLVEALARDARVVDDRREREPLSRDSDEDYLIALARWASADVLVSGDADLLALELPDLAILSPREFVDLLP
jgi:putative PIN family toxin of toxin-antitoxin system